MANVSHETMMAGNARVQSGGGCAAGAARRDRGFCRIRNGIAMALGMALALASVHPACADGCQILDDVSASVKSSWRKLAKCSDYISDLRDERKNLPDDGWWWTTTKSDQDAKIRKQLRRMRELLLSTNAQKILAAVDELDEEIAGLDESIRVAQEDFQLSDDANREKHAVKLDKLTSKKDELQKRRSEEAAKVYEELRALGLNVSGKAAEECLFTANIGDIIDGVIVSKNVAAVVDNLRDLMMVGDVTASRRYYGMYLVLLDVQIVCFEDYLEKSRSGVWRKKLEQMGNDALELRDRAQSVKRSKNYLPGQDAHLIQSIRQNEATLKAIDAYLKILDSHEAVIGEKLATARKGREVIAISYETLNIASDFIQFAKSNMELFNSLEQLTLPPIELFNDAAIQREFVEITKKLKED